MNFVDEQTYMEQTAKVIGLTIDIRELFMWSLLASPITSSFVTQIFARTKSSFGALPSFKDWELYFSLFSEVPPKRKLIHLYSPPPSNINSLSVLARTLNQSCQGAYLPNILPGLICDLLSLTNHETLKWLSDIGSEELQLTFEV